MNRLNLDRWVGCLPGGPSQEQRTVRRVRALLAEPWSYKVCEDVKQICFQAGWPFLDMQEDRVQVLLARTPGGMMFRVMPRMNRFGSGGPMPMGYHRADIRPSFSWMQPNDDREAWENELSGEMCLALSAALPEGCTPMIDASASGHRSLEWRGAWMQAQKAVSGWSGQVVSLPRDIVLPDTDGLVAVRQGRAVAILEAPLSGLSALVALDPRVSLPPLRAVGVYLRAVS